MNGVKGNSSLVRLKFCILESFCQSFTAKYATVSIACFVNNEKNVSSKHRINVYMKYL